MTLYLTGTGTSQGVPVIGCGCPVCLSADSRDKRLRTAAVLEMGDTRLAIDTGPDFRQQMLSLGVPTLAGVFLTHEHNDHVAGLDDIRPFNFISGGSLPVFGLASVLRQIEQRFAYIFADAKYPGAPQLDLVELSPYHELQVGQIKLTPFLVYHGDLPVLGFRAGGLVYITDASSMPPETEKLIRGCDTLVINALRQTSHRMHFSLPEVLDIASRLAVRSTLVTHVSHQMGKFAEVSELLPKSVSLAYDGQILRPKQVEDEL